jgi:cytochrome P450
MMDLFSEEMRRNPYPAYDRMRETSPVFHHELFGIWMIFDFEGVKRALMDHDAFSSDLSHVPGSGNPGEWFNFFDPPRHTKLRGLISKAFTPRVTADEVLGFVQLLLVAGQETTANLLNNAVLCFIENPDQLARLRAAPDLLTKAIEEVLRYRSPIQWMPRATRRDIEMHGQLIPAGKLVLPMIGSANRDARQFRNADGFDISRDPNPHIAFGHGIHSCLGTPLARMEARIGLTDFLERVKEFDLASDEPWEPRKAFHVHGPSRLPIRFKPG